MIKLNSTEAQITAKVVLEALGIAIAPSSIQGLQIHSVEVEGRTIESVVVVTEKSLHSIGKPYFKSLVTKYKAATVTLDAAVDQRGAVLVKNPKQSIESPKTAKSPTYAQQVKARAAKLLGFGSIITKAQLKNAIINRGSTTFMQAVDLERNGNDFYYAADKALDRIEKEIQDRKHSCAG